MYRLFVLYCKHLWFKISLSLSLILNFHDIMVCHFRFLSCVGHVSKKPKNLKINTTLRSPTNFKKILYFIHREHFWAPL